jgi:iron complex outermembrane receptor protein
LEHFSELTIAANINNLLNVLPEWQFKAENSNGTAIINNQLLSENN